MFIRCAFFQGHVKPGMEDAFNRYFRARKKCVCCAKSKAM
jgi:hypothetical protein